MSGGESAIPDGTPVYGCVSASIGLEIGIGEDGSGYIKFSEEREETADFEYQFPIPASEVQKFMQRRNEHQSLSVSLSPPDDVRQTIEVERDGWDTSLRHTGGGMWVRKFTKEFGTGTVSVEYDPKYLEGVQAGYYDDGFEGEITLVNPEAEDADEDDYIAAAKRLMDKIDNGMFDDAIASLKDG